MGGKIVIVGAGAVGGYTGAHMVQAGEDVTFVDPWPAHVEHMRKHGLRVTHAMKESEFTVPVRALHVTDAQQLAKEKPVDIAFVCMKSYDTAWATMLIGQYLAPDGYVVSLQNCINEPTVAGVVGWVRRSAASPRALPSICRNLDLFIAAPPSMARRTRCFGPARSMAASPRAPRKCAGWWRLPTAPK